MIQSFQYKSLRCQKGKPNYSSCSKWGSYRNVLGQDFLKSHSSQDIPSPSMHNFGVFSTIPLSKVLITINFWVFWYNYIDNSGCHVGMLHKVSQSPHLGVWHLRHTTIHPVNTHLGVWRLRHTTIPPVNTCNFHVMLRLRHCTQAIFRSHYNLAVYHTRFDVTCGKKSISPTFSTDVRLWYQM